MGKGIGTGKGLGRGRGHGSGAAKGQGSGDGSGDYKGKTERIAIPAMPMPMAVICCILNFLLPGFGTMVAGLSNFCCSRNEDIDGAVRIVSCCTNLEVGCLQLLATALCLIGWIWSCVWGAYFIAMSSEYYHNNSVDDTDRQQGVVISQYNRPVVVGQPGAQVNVVSVVRQPVGTPYGQPMVQHTPYGQPVVQPTPYGQTIIQPNTYGQPVIVTNI